MKRVFFVAVAALALFAQNSISEACCAQINSEGEIISDCTGSHAHKTIVAGGCTERPDGGPGVKNGMWSDPPENCGIEPWLIQHRCELCGKYVHVGEPHSCWPINLDSETDFDNPKSYQYTACPICGDPIIEFNRYPDEPGKLFWRCKKYHHGFFAM